MNLILFQTIPPVKLIYYVFIRAILPNGFNKLYIILKSYLITIHIEDIKNNYYIVKLNKKHDLKDFHVDWMTWMTF